MALTPSTMLPLGTKAPDFELLDTKSGKIFSLQELKSPKATVIMFICNHCPYVKHVQTMLISLAKDYQTQGIAFIAISANDAENYPEDAPKEMAKLAKHLAYPFPYLYDETQNTAKSYQAACTPDFYLFDNDLLCVYRGQLDDSRPGNKIPVTGKSLRAALDNLLAGKSIDPDQKPSMGCNIKWKA
jgi:peroxiredoxin